MVKHPSPQSYLIRQAGIPLPSNKAASSASLNLTLDLRTPHNLKRQFDPHRSAFALRRLHGKTPPSGLHPLAHLGKAKTA